MNDLKIRLKRLVVEALRLEDVDPASIPDSAPLFGEGPLNLDSVDALELVLEIERSFGIQLEDDSKTREFLFSIDSLAEYLAPLVGEG
ncbi:MAG: acyl carrier protein [Deltaproteobacteria bacterium]|nr:acyl carrier protein [Deltaproteobacteria bacterium]